MTREGPGSDRGKPRCDPQIPEGVACRPLGKAHEILLAFLPSCPQSHAGEGIPDVVRCPQSGLNPGSDSRFRSAVDEERDARKDDSGRQPRSASTQRDSDGKPRHLERR
jgi:hypothetical protein